MLKNIINTAKLIFTDKNVKELEKQTKENHNYSSKIMFRELNEISTKFEITEVYRMDLEFESETEKIKSYSFSKADISTDFDVRKSFLKNEGTLYLVDEKEKIEINKRFKFTYNYSPIHDQESLDQSPDFVYELGNIQYWVFVEPKRNETEEIEHTEILEFIYQVISNSKSIQIDNGFEHYGSTPNEKWYDLLRFRLDRQSLFLVFQDRDDLTIFSHEFKNIKSIKTMDLQNSLKVWVYMPEGTHRFYLHYNRYEILDEYKHYDPIIYK